jgi:hypothetical protein
MQASVSLTEAEGKEGVPAFDFTKLTALNTCPRYGLIRYDQHKRMPDVDRNIPLEMGSAAHECFAAIRYFELLEYGPAFYGNAYDPEPVFRKAIDLFGPGRVGEIERLFRAREDARRRAYSIAHYIAETSGFYDDPKDRRRTLSNLQDSLVCYIDRLELGRRIPIIDPLVGIEVPIDITITFTGAATPVVLRYVGLIDGLVHPDGDRDRVQVEENKTAARLNTAWQDSFITSHQVTGYCVAASKITGKLVSDCMIRGMMIPLPREYDLGGIVNAVVSRDSNRVREWVRWVYHTYGIWLAWKDDPLNAPEYTHSCNRYFASCTFLPLCAMADPTERELNYSLMVHDEWNPLAVGDRHAN